MTSEQVMLALLLALSTMVGGCGLMGGGRRAMAVDAPYEARQVWAVAPLRNESGTEHADGLRLADTLAMQLENVGGIDVLPVNRTLEAMQLTGISRITTPAEAQKLIHTMDVDGMVIGTITAYDPYDPPKLAMAIELYLSRNRLRGSSLDVHELQRKPTGDEPAMAELDPQRPVNVVSIAYNAASPAVRDRMRIYAVERGASEHIDESWRLYRISMDLFTEFVCHAASRRLMRAETQRLAPISTAAAEDPS